MTTTGTVVVISVFLEEVRKLTHHPKNTYKAVSQSQLTFLSF